MRQDIVWINQFYKILSVKDKYINLLIESYVFIMNYKNFKKLEKINKSIYFLLITISVVCFEELLIN